MSEYFQQLPEQPVQTSFQYEATVYLPEATKTNVVTPDLPLPVPSTAIISVIFGVLGICFTPPFVGAVVALVAGVLAQRTIRRANGQLGGKRQALAGIIMGGIGIALSILIAFVWLVSILLAVASK